MKATLAALAAIPGRDPLPTLRSLRSQVDRLCLYWNGPETALPAGTRAIADEVRINPANGGSVRKLAWASEWDGLYLACDDDLIYPPDYAAVMGHAVQRWDGRALVVAQGRRLHPDATTYADCDLAGRALASVAVGAWLNYPGACALAFDASVVPVGDAPMPYPNQEQECLALWAQQTQTPIWLVAHVAGWIQPVPAVGATLWQQAVARGHDTENRLIASGRPWRVHVCAT